MHGSISTAMELEAGSPAAITSVTNTPVFDFETREDFTTGTITMEAADVFNSGPTASF